ncbi:MAG: hypothetical protein LBG74_01705 [Spirochaetaceae bacterium]|jgi:predicted membrane channel-forming protein YqfA (hemolysin III family)|nr:hypothetical protein [Spirochaetaceae bacterium]
MFNLLSKRLLARLVFFSGIFFMVVGSGILISAYTGVSRLPILGSFLIMGAGISCAALAIKLNRRSLYLYFAVFSILTGLFLFLWAEAVIPLPLNRCWPFLSLFAGLSQLPSGFYKHKKPKAVYIVPAVAFIVLGCVLLVFSFRLAPFSFKQFILNWWHLLLVLAGFLLVLLSISGKKN